MTVIKRLRVSWSGSAVTGPGLSTFYCSTADTTLASGAKAFFTAGVGIAPTALSWIIPVTGDLIEDSDGSLAGVWTETAGTGGTVTGTNAGTWAQGVGARIKWLTGGTHAGRRVVGSTFIVPIVVNGYEGSNMITAAYLSTLSSMASAYLSATPTLRILSKPTTYHGSPIVGKSSQIVTHLEPDQVSWLRGRRT